MICLIKQSTQYKIMKLHLCKIEDCDLEHSATAQVVNCVFLLEQIFSTGIFYVSRQNMTSMNGALVFRTFEIHLSISHLLNFILYHKDRKCADYTKQCSAHIFAYIYLRQ